MKASYRKLFSISLYHQYYQDGRPTDVSLEPTEKSLAFCEDYGLNIKKMGSGVVVLMKDRVNAHRFEKGAMISLFLQVDTPYFLNFTNIMQLKLEEKLVFNNLRTSSAVLGDSYVYHLNEKDEIDNSYQYKICSMVKLLARYQKADHVKIRDDFDDVLFEGEGVELHELAPGVWEGLALKVEADDKPAVQYFCTDVESTLRSPAIINIYLSPDGVPLEGEPNYSLSFRSRPVTWVYKFVGPTNRECTAITIQKGRKTLPFSEIEEAEELRGKRAIVVESEEPYALQQREDDPLTAQLELLDLDTNKKAVIQKRLTYPDIDTIQIYEEGEAYVTKSETYIYY